MTIQIKNGRVIDPANKIDAVLDVYVADGKIAAIGSKPSGFGNSIYKGFRIAAGMINFLPVAGIKLAAEVA